MKARIVFVLLLLIASFFRLYRIADFTEFRGDQGIAAEVVYNAVQSKTIPLTGPAVSTGELPGPAYYYLIALPLILSNFNPLVPAIMFAVMGVAVVGFFYYLGSRMFGTYAGFVIAGLYAVSPPVVAHSRNMWNPTAIPFFVVLILLSLYKIHTEKKRTFILLASFSAGILVQLHYTNGLWIPFIFFFWCYEYLMMKHTKYTKPFVLWGLGAVIAFLVPLLPFLFYEIPHQLIDIRQIFTSLVGPSPGVANTRFLWRIGYVTQRMFFHVFPLLTPPFSYLPVLLIIPPFILRRNFWAVFFASLTVVSIIILSWYKGPFFDHYLRFVRPLPFFLAGYAISVFPKKIVPIAAGISIFIIAMFYIPKLNMKQIRFGDIDQTRVVTDLIRGRSAGQQFSFGLISSPSYSDYHYRFFFTLAHARPLPITDTTYRTLYLACEDTKCPPYPFTDIGSMKKVRVFCYEPVCSAVYYPEVDLTNFYLTHTDVMPGHITLYTYRRNNGNLP